MSGKFKVVLLFALGITGASVLYSVETSRAEGGKRTAALRPEQIQEIFQVRDNSDSEVSADELLAEIETPQKLVPARYSPDHGNDSELRGASFINQDGDDPLAWLEGSANCDVISSAISSRYGVKQAGQRPLNAEFYEEFRHISRYTCAEQKYSNCDFSWCNALVAKAGEKRHTADAFHQSALEIERELARKLEQNKVDASQVSRAQLAYRDSNQVRPSAAVNEIPKAEPIRFRPELEPIPPFAEMEVANTAARRSAPESVDAIARAQAESSGKFFAGEAAMNAHLAERARQDALLKLAEEQLANLVREKQAQPRGEQIARVSRDKSNASDWLKIVVPGSERLPRPRVRAETLAPSQEIGGAEGGRSIVPSAGAAPVAGAPISSSQVGRPAIPAQQQLGHVGQPPRPGIDHNTAEREIAIRDEYLHVLQRGAQGVNKFLGDSSLR